MPKIQMSCKHCEKKFTRWPSQIKRYKYGAFCSNVCIGKFRTEHLVGTLAANFKDGHTSERDYVLVLTPWHPNNTKKNYSYLHRIVAEAKLGRFLREDEIVHHKDGNKENNHWDNLEIMTQSEHIHLHLENGDIRKVKHG